MSTAAIPAPGQLITFFAALDGYRKRNLFVQQLPLKEQDAIDQALVSLQGYMERDIHVGPMLEGAVQRISDAVEQGLLGQIQKADLATVSRFLCAVPTTVRGA